MQTHNTPVPSRRPVTGRRLGIAAALAALALALAACGGGTNASASGGQPSVTITSPAAGASVGRTFTVRMNLDFPIGRPDTGRQHIHLHFDGSSDYDIVYTATHQVTLTPGRHTIVAVVANADHSETSSKSRTVTVNVGNGASAGSTPTPTTSTGNGYGY
jgi:hypothetical protein